MAFNYPENNFQPQAPQIIPGQFNFSSVSTPMPSSAGFPNGYPFNLNPDAALVPQIRVFTGNEGPMAIASGWGPSIVPNPPDLVSAIPTSLQQLLPLNGPRAPPDVTLPPINNNSPFPDGIRPWQNSASPGPQMSFNTRHLQGFRGGAYPTASSTGRPPSTLLPAQHQPMSLLEIISRTQSQRRFHQASDESPCGPSTLSPPLGSSACAKMDGRTLGSSWPPASSVEWQRKLERTLPPSMMPQRYSRKRKPVDPLYFAPRSVKQRITEEKVRQSLSQLNLDGASAGKSSSEASSPGILGPSSSMGGILGCRSQSRIRQVRFSDSDEVINDVEEEEEDLEESDTEDDGPRIIIDQEALDRAKVLQPNVLPEVILQDILKRDSLALIPWTPPSIPLVGANTTIAVNDCDELENNGFLSPPNSRADSPVDPLPRPLPPRGVRLGSPSPNPN